MKRLSGRGIITLIFGGWVCSQLVIEILNYGIDMFFKLIM